MSLILSVRNYIILAYVFGSSLIYAQVERNPYILTKNSFSIELATGFNRTKFENVAGNSEINSPLGVLHRLNIDYTFRVTDNLGLSVGGGIGFFPFVYSIEGQNGFFGTDVWRYKDLVNYNPFSMLRSALKYQRWIAPKFMMKGSIGAGFYKMTPFHISALSESPAGADYSLEVEYGGEFTPNLSFSLGIDRLLKNDDLVGLSLTYDYLSGPIHTGFYKLENGSTYGNVYNTGNNLSIGLNYTFTRARKMLATEKSVLDENVSFKDGKKKFRKEKRFIDPKSIFIGAGGGFSGAKNIVDKNFPYLKSASIVDWVFNANIEVGHKGDRFWQFGFSTSQYYTAQNLNIPSYPMFGGASGGSLFKVSQVSGGYGLRLIGKNNINYLNVSTGAAVHFVHIKKEFVGEVFSGLSSAKNEFGDTVFVLENKGEIVSRVFPTLYLNIGRDFQLSRSVYFTFDYRFNIGFVSTYKEEVVYRGLPDISNQETGEVKINGTSYAFQIGLKYKFVPKRNKDILKNDL